jgi:hypothetical protein
MRLAAALETTGIRSIAGLTSGRASKDEATRSACTRASLYRFPSWARAWRAICSWVANQTPGLLFICWMSRSSSIMR